MALVRALQDIIFGVTGQTIYLDVTEGRPSAVSDVDVYAWDSADTGATESAIGAGSVESNPNTTIDADSGTALADARQLFVAATTGITEDRTYLVTSATYGHKEWFTAKQIKSADYVVAQHPLHNAYALNDTVQSTRIQATVDSTWVADTGNLRDDAGPNPHYRVRWQYVVGGVTYVADSYFNLVRYVGKHGVRPQDIDSLVPQWLDTLPTDHRADQGRALLDDAYRAVKLDLHQVWTDDAMVANTEVIDELTRYKAVELGLFANAVRSGDDGRYALAKSTYQSRFDALARITVKVPVRDSSGAAQEKPALGLSRR